jgi:hypothetical protein
MQAAWVRRWPDGSLARATGSAGNDVSAATACQGPDGDLFYGEVVARIGPPAATR